MKQTWRTWEGIASRITGFSVPLFGISWNPPVSDRTAAERCITSLESTGLLYADFEWEQPNECYVAASRLRDELTRQLQELAREAPVFRQLDAIREACRVFRDTLRRKGFESVSHHSDLHDHQKAEFLQTLGALRDTCGKQIMLLAVQYGVDVAPHLAAWLPAPDAAKAEDETV
jgi:hypothetical protein